MEKCGCEFIDGCCVSMCDEHWEDMQSYFEENEEVK